MGLHVASPPQLAASHPLQSLFHPSSLHSSATVTELQDLQAWSEVKSKETIDSAVTQTRRAVGIKRNTFVTTARIWKKIEG